MRERAREREGEEREREKEQEQEKKKDYTNEGRPRWQIIRPALQYAFKKTEIWGTKDRSKLL